MQAAISELTIAVNTMETNEPINRKSGNIEQAELQANNAAEYRQAIEVLKAASKGPVWVGPDLKVVGQDIDWQKAAITAGHNEAKAMQEVGSANLRTLFVCGLFVGYVILSAWK